MSVIFKNTRNKLYSPGMAVLITLLTCLVLLTAYLYRPLHGNFNQFFLPAKMFGVPTELRAHGITELFTDKNSAGWDGQFYYYIANDIGLKKDTIEHLDSEAYRYQRIGLPLLAKIVSLLTFQSWVTPLTYYLTSLCLVLLGTWAAAFFFQKNGVHPYWVLLWSLGLGTQITQSAGLPDAAADGLLIGALVCLMEKKRWLYVLAMSFAALAREIYILIPAGMLFAISWYELQNKENSSFSEMLKNVIKNAWMHAVPIFIEVSWQLWVRIKLGASSSSEAHQVLGWPLQTALEFMKAGIEGNHPYLGSGLFAYLQSVDIFLYLILLTLSGFYLWPFLQALQGKMQNNFMSMQHAGMALGFIGIVALYLCFGPIVMMYHTGYFKAANIFFFVIPFAAIVSKRLWTNKTQLFLVGTSFVVWFSTAGKYLQKFL